MGPFRMSEVTKSSAWKLDPAASNRLLRKRFFFKRARKQDLFSKRLLQRLLLIKSLQTKLLARRFFDEISNLRPNFLITKAQTNCGYYLFYTNDRIFFYICISH